MRQITFDSIHQGPFAAVNGGYVSGILGEALGEGPSSVRLRRPVPIETPIELLVEDDTASLRLGNEILAQAERSPDDVARSAFVSPDEASRAVDPDIDRSIFADCFVCGRPAPHGLGVQPRRLADGRFVSVWRPADSLLVDTQLVPGTYLRSALDCPGGFAAVIAAGQLAVTGSLTSRIAFLPPARDPLIAVGEATWRDGRKLGAVTTLFTESGELVATGEAVWVTLGAMPVEPAA